MAGGRPLTLFGSSVDRKEHFYRILIVIWRFHITLVDIIINE